MRIQTIGKTKGVRVMAFQTLESGIVAQIMNSNSTETQVNIAHRTYYAHDCTCTLNHHRLVVTFVRTQARIYQARRRRRGFYRKANQKDAIRTSGEKPWVSLPSVQMARREL